MQKATQRNVLIISCLIFLSLGITTAVIGPILPELAANNQVGLAAIGSVFSALFLGALLAQLISGPFSDRVGQTPVLVGAALLLAAGSVGLTLSRSLPLTLALAFTAGLGHGAVDLCTNVLIARVYAGRSVSALNLLNLFFGVGAFLAPAAVGLFLAGLGSGLGVMWLVAGLLAIQAVFVLRLRAPLSPSQTGGQVQQNGRIYGSALVWLLALLLMLYVGTESGIAGWITTYMSQTTAISYERATLIASAFWLALTAGRLVSALIGMRASARSVLLISLAGSLAGGLLQAASSGNAALTIAGVLLTGFSFGSIYPTVISLAAEAFPNQPGRAVSVVAAMGSVGGMLLPWLQGVLLERFNPSVSMLFVLVAIGLMAIVFGAIVLLPGLAKKQPAL